MLTGGKLADLFGRRLLFVLGLSVFTLASLACGLATSGDVLIAARIVQGVGAALMNPATLSIISATFPPPDARGASIRREKRKRPGCGSGPLSARGRRQRRRSKRRDSAAKSRRRIGRAPFLARPLRPHQASGRCKVAAL